MALILPGQEFEVDYGGGRTFPAKALTGLQQVELAELFQNAIKAEVEGDLVGVYKAARECLDYIMGEDDAMELWATSIDARIAMDVVRQVLNSGALSEDEEKN